MASLTPLHETYCKWDRTPPSQADVLEGLAQLVSTSLTGVHELVQLVNTEMMQSTLGLTEQQSKRFQKLPRVQNLYQWSYEAIQKSGHYLLAPGLRHIIDRFPALHDRQLTPTLHFLVGVLNGVLGDYLLKQHNPMALPMVLYDHYGEVHRGDLKGRVVIFAHGLCMNHLDWSTAQYPGIPERLLSQRDQKTVLYLSYNTGRRISANGRSFANTLYELLHNNPEISSIDIIGHSMGGLVARSALFYGKQNLHNWVERIDRLVCLGSPHHGAALERFGFSLQEKLGRFPFVKIIGHLANIRSCGILDLRHGSVRDDDWEHLEARIGLMDDNRKPAPLPTHIKTYLVAGTLESENSKSKALNVIGDYLVSVKSALGEHPNPRLRLKLPESHKAVFYGLNHFDIQFHSSVAEQIIAWFYADQPDQDAGIQTHEVEKTEAPLMDWHRLAGIVET